MKLLSNTTTRTFLKLTAILMIVATFSGCHFMPLRHGGGHHGGHNYSAGHSVTRSVLVTNQRARGH